MMSEVVNGESRTMSEDQFFQVVGAIVDGKYSWACLLILKFSGYNPLHYIPYRTYNRIMKDNSHREFQQKATLSNSLKSCTKKYASLSVKDLSYAKSLDEAKQEISGGAAEFFDYR